MAWYIYIGSCLSSHNAKQFMNKKLSTYLDSPRFTPLDFISTKELTEKKDDIKFYIILLKLSKKLNVR